MHPQIVQPGLGNCLICGTALEPMTAAMAGEEEVSPELVDMTRRFWVSLALTVPLVILATGRHVRGLRFEHWLAPHVLNWIEFALATPVVLWGLAVIHARVGFSSDSAVEHVHADRARRRRRG
jgi:P-type Cu+ transporter